MIKDSFEGEFSFNEAATSVFTKNKSPASDRFTTEFCKQN